MEDYFPNLTDEELMERVSKLEGKQKAVYDDNMQRNSGMRLSLFRALSFPIEVKEKEICREEESDG